METSLLHHDMAQVIDRFKDFRAPPLETLSVDAARNAPTLKNAVEELVAESLALRATTLIKPVPEPVEQISHVTIPARGGELLARVFYPSGDGPHPVVLYFHGGGWVIANLDVYEPSCRAVCNAAGAMVISVAYRQAPEHPFPAAVDDAADALQWALREVGSLGGDPARVVVAGESAGGNLATVACLRATEEGGALPVGQLLIYPVTDFRGGRASYAENQHTLPLHSGMMDWFAGHYLGEEKEELVAHPWVSPLLADVRQLPPALVIGAEFDPLRDEGQEYAEKLTNAGVLTVYHLAEGVTHEFFGLAGLVKPAKETLDLTAEWLKDRWDWERLENKVEPEPMEPMPARSAA